MLFLVVLGALPGLSQSVTYPPNGINSSIANSSTSRAWMPNGSISGNVLDIKGNNVPQAFITLYKDGRIINDHQVFSGDGINGSMGEYEFTGLDSGNYKVTAEKADGQLLYNGTASVILIGDVRIKLDVTLNGYVFKPWITPTPVPMAAPEATEAPEPTALPTAKPSDAMGSFNPLYMLALLPLAIAGILMVIRVKKRLPKANTVKNNINKMPASPQITVNNKGVDGASQLIKNNAEYGMEIEELIKKNTASGYTDIAMINKINELAKKFGIDQNTIFYDMRKMKDKSK